MAAWSDHMARTRQQRSGRGHGRRLGRCNKLAITLRVEQHSSQRHSSLTRSWKTLVSFLDGNAWEKSRMYNRQSRPRDGQTWLWEILSVVAGGDLWGRGPTASPTAGIREVFLPVAWACSYQPLRLRHLRPSKSQPSRLQSHAHHVEASCCLLETRSVVAIVFTLGREIRRPDSMTRSRRCPVWITSRPFGGRSHDVQIGATAQTECYRHSPSPAI